MYHKKLVIFFLLCLFAISNQAQTNPKQAIVDSISLSLYYAQDWESLFHYGKKEIASGNEFDLLRMRTGYAALQLSNYSESLKQYGKILHEKPTNNIAIYYAYLNNVYLNNTTASRYYARKLAKEERRIEKIKWFKIFLHVFD